MPASHHSEVNLTVPSPHQPLSEGVEAWQRGQHEAGMLPMVYDVRWQLVGRSGQPLDSGYMGEGFCAYGEAVAAVAEFLRLDRKSTRLNSSHANISYAVFCLKKKRKL